MRRNREGRSRFSDSEVGLLGRTRGVGRGRGRYRTCAPTCCRSAFLRRRGGDTYTLRDVGTTWRRRDAFRDAYYSRLRSGGWGQGRRGDLVRRIGDACQHRKFGSNCRGVGERVAIKACEDGDREDFVPEFLANTVAGILSAGDGLPWRCTCGRCR